MTAPGQAPPAGTPGGVKRPRVVVLLPARDEEAAIGKVMDTIPRDTLARRGFNVEVVVVDGGSRDRTVEVVRAQGARVIPQRVLGKGRGVRQALDDLDADYFVMLDADNTYPTEDIPVFLELLSQGYDVVMGSRLTGDIEEGAMNTVNGLGNRVLSLLASLLYGRRVSDVCTGMWAFRHGIVKSLPLESNRFELEAELYALSVRAGLRILEVPIRYRCRIGSTKLGRARDGAAIAFTLFRRRFSKLTFRVHARRPMRAA